MIKFFWQGRPRAPSRKFAAAPERALAADCPDWVRDPLNHPTVEAMSLTELADLPAGQLRSYCRE